MSRYRYTQGPDGKVMKITTVGGQELYTEATAQDIKDMSTKDKVKYSAAIKDKSKRKR